MTEHSPIPDVQGFEDQRRIPITRVGIRDIRIPLAVQTAAGAPLHTIAEASLTVALPHDKKGTHMSRFIGLIQQAGVLALEDLPALLRTMLNLLNAREGTITLQFPYFVEKTAPVSGEKSLMDYATTWQVDGSVDTCEVTAQVVVPVTSLCPCSKEISKYGAHNQRSHIVINALFDPARPFAVEALIAMGEEGGSCPIWSTLKRPDEKYVTERAYENPKFVEDIVRDVAISLNADERIARYRVSSENFESIHNHSAFAVIAHDKRS